jgi:uncharacterized protein (TIGR02300 family)
VAKPELGMKRQCQNCGAKFFDLNRDPIVCPKCGTTFQATATVSRAAPRAAAPVADDDADTENPNVELVSLEEADASEEKVAASSDDDIEIEDDDSADETFLEEEEGDSDDVSGLIDSDLEDDEEA